MSVLNLADAVYLDGQLADAVYSGANHVWPPVSDESVYDAAVLADHPIAFWPLNEAAGAVAADASGNGHAAAYTGGVTLDQPGIGDGESAALFDGASGHAAVPYTPALQPALITAEIWVYPTAAGGCGYLCSNIYTSNVGYELNDGQTGPPGVGFGRFVPVQGWASAGLPTSLPLNQWHHIIGTGDGGYLAFYLDGARVGALSAPLGGTPLGYDPTEFRIASAHAGVLFKGRLAKAAVYGVILSPDRIAAHYYAAVGRARPQELQSGVAYLADGSPLPYVFESDVQKGDLIVVAVGASTGSAVTNAGMSNTGTAVLGVWQQTPTVTGGLPGWFASAPLGYQTTLYYATVRSGGSLTVAYTNPAGTDYTRITCYEFANLSAIVDRAATASGSGNTVASVGPVTTAHPDEVTVALPVFNDGHPTPGPGYVGSAVNNSEIAQYGFAPEPGAAITATANTDVATSWMMQLATFRYVSGPLYAPMVLADHPVAYYRLGDAHDLMGGPDAVLGPHVQPHASILPGGDGASVSLTDPTSIITVPDSPPLRIGAADFTLEAWIKLSAFAPYTVFIDTVERAFAMFFQDVSIGFLGAGGTSSSGVIFAQSLAVGSVFHVVFALGGGVFTNIVNGTPYYRAEGIGQGGSNAAAGFAIGGGVSGGNPTFQGQIQEVAIYNYALPVSRAIAHYQAVT